jgi:anthranilate phosphoribosyltransferase
MIEQFIPQLARREALADEQVHQAVEWLTDPALGAGPKAAFLAALAEKGETPAEIAAFVRALRGKSLKPDLDPALREREILDIVGTGGDRLGTINISTTAALICAAAGVTVAKHGNRAVTSQAGSADVLEELGIPINLPPDQAALALRDHQFAFFFAQHYHPAFQHIGPARKLCATRGQRTIFNLLGPLLNPAGPSAMLVGVPRPELCRPLAVVLQSLGVRRAMVVCGQVGLDGYLDELSTLGDNTIAEFYQDHGFTVSLARLDLFSLQPAKLADLKGGTKTENADIVRRILRNEERGPKRDAVLLNAAAALFVAGQAKSLIEGWDLAAETLDNGRAAAKLTELTQPPL